MDTQRPLAITVGDPAGVGPEIIARWCHENPGAQPVTVIGPASWLALPAFANVARIPVGDLAYEAIAGKPTAAGARIALAAMEEAAAGTREGRFAGVVTGPVSKAELSAVGYPFPGQTEFFAARWGGVPTMAFLGGRLRVALATWHVPLMDVSRALNPVAIERAVRGAAELARCDGIDSPRIAMCGLNPHAGEGGLLGREEHDWIDPFLDTLRRKYPGLSRCLPADTVFGRALRGDFDVVVALYHDQGLGPLKTVDFDESVNVTLGLPWVRTSPDHGTAFGIAGQGIASVTSFTNAVDVARRLIYRSLPR